MVLSATPWASVGAGEYGDVVTASVSLPVGDAAPAGYVYFYSDFGASVFCQSTGWNLTTSGGVDTYVASCAQEGDAAFVGVEVAEYEGSDDYALGNELISLNVVIEGDELGGASGNEYEAVLVEPASAASPSGTVTFTDGIGGACSSSSWTGTDVGDSTEGYLASCDITTSQPLGTVVSATYAGSDFTIYMSNPLTLVGLSLSGSPENSASANSYTATLDSPLGPAPKGNLDVDDTNGGSCFSGTWTDAGSDLSGGELYTATCNVVGVERVGTTVTATYSFDGFDMLAPTTNSITVPSAPVRSFLLSGSPVASANGNSYTVWLKVPSDLAPTGSATVVDDAPTPGSCSASSWTGLHGLVSGGEEFVATCSISTPETAGETVQATYVGSDYTSAASNTLTVQPGPATSRGPTSPATQAPLLVTTLTGQVGSALSLSTIGGSGTGSISYSVINGSASGCLISGDTLTSSSEGTCLVTATKAQDATYATASSSVTAISMALPPRPGVLKVGFRPLAGSLNAHAQTSLAALSRRLLSGASVTVTGYARSDRKLARARAESVARFLARQMSIHVLVRTSTSSPRHEVIVTTTSQ
jgi:hypothetical protein